RAGNQRRLLYRLLGLLRRQGQILDAQWQAGEVADLVWGRRHQLSMPAREIGEAQRIVEIAPLRFQHMDRGIVRLDLAVHLAQLALLALHVVFDLEQADAEQRQHDHPDDGADADHAASRGASVRSATRKRAERARGFALISASPGSMPPGAISRKVGLVSLLC